MRRQLRSFLSDEESKSLYSHEYDHTQWDEHVRRVDLTVALGIAFARRHNVKTVADLSCGDGAVLTGIADAVYLDETYYGDVVGDDNDYEGPIEETIDQLFPVDLFVCTETIEHLRDPDDVLRRVRGKTRYLLLSTPLLEPEPRDNSEHIWEWDLAGVAELVGAAGFTDECVTVLKEQHYTYQIWMCR